MRVIGYARVSTDEQAQEGYSLLVQEAKIQAYCHLYDLELAEMITDGGVSAKTLKRPGLTMALGKLEAGEADGFIILKLDRLTRSVADWEALIDGYFGDKAGKALFSVTDQIDTRSAGGRLVLRVLITVAQWEREAIGERTAAALAQKKAMGEHVGGVPFGYRVAGTTLVPIAQEAKAIDLARALRAVGLPLHAIAAELNARAIPTKRGGRWQSMQVKRILERASTLGHLDAATPPAIADIPATTMEIRHHG